MISNAYMLLIIYGRVGLTQLYIAFLSCLLHVEESIYQFKLELGSSMRIYINRSEQGMNRVLLVLDIWFSLAYRKGLIYGVKLSVVVPQSIGISLCNRIGDSIGEFLVIFPLGVFIDIQCS